MTSDHGLTVTFKHGKAYDDTWTVIKALSVSELRHDLLAYFDIDASAVEGLTTFELVTNLTGVVHGSSNAATMLGAVAIPQVDRASLEQTDNPWAGLDDDDTKEETYLSTESPFQHLFDAMNAATDVKELQKVWATNQAAFQNEELMTAYKARGKELSK
jgi:hypothetical protein